MPGNFILNITGSPRKTGAIQIFLGIVKARFEKFSPDHTVEIINFARINYRIEVKGTPERIDYLDNMMGSVKLYMGRYFSDWHYEIDVFYTESGG